MSSTLVTVLFTANTATAYSNKAAKPTRPSSSANVLHHLSSMQWPSYQGLALQASICASMYFLFLIRCPEKRDFSFLPLAVDFANFPHEENLLSSEERGLCLRHHKRLMPTRQKQTWRTLSANMSDDLDCELLLRMQWSCWYLVGSRWPNGFVR